MAEWPRISIVTPSFNQGNYIAETIESVMAQDYPDLEHIIVDGGSTDNTIEILRRYPHLKWISEPDRGQADAINKGFRLASGNIWGFLNSDDTLLPGALQRVAREIDPKRGRHVVMGRCRFVDEGGTFIGIEHPSHFESHGRVLKVWKGHTIPQPAVFWTPEVWRTCGGMDENLESAWIDYDLFCRFSRSYHFHFMDQVLSNYRLHANSKTLQRTESGCLEESIRISRRYWGRPYSLTYWKMNASLALYRINRTGRARTWIHKAREHWQRKQLLRALPYAVAGGLLAPEVAFYVAAYPALRGRAEEVLKVLLDRLSRKRGAPVQTLAYMERTESWEDGWVGPRLIVSREARAGTQHVIINGCVDLKYIRKRFVLTAVVDGKILGHKHIREDGHFTMQVALPQPVSPGSHRIEVQANTWFVPHLIASNNDFRPLAWRLTHIDML